MTWRIIGVDFMVDEEENNNDTVFYLIVVAAVLLGSAYMQAILPIKNLIDTFFGTGCVTVASLIIISVIVKEIRNAGAKK